MSNLDEENRKRLESLQKLEAKDEQMEAVTVAEQLSIRDRLMRRLKSNTIKIAFDDREGEFFIETRFMSPDEQRRLSGYQTEMTRLKVEIDKGPSPDEIKVLGDRGMRVLDEIFGLVGDLCIDPSLNYDYWKAGVGYNLDVPMTILNQVLLASQQTEAETARFRRK